MGDILFHSIHYADFKDVSLEVFLKLRSLRSEVMVEAKNSNMTSVPSK